jgi:hypothetical protein
MSTRRYRRIYLTINTENPRDFLYKTDLRIGFIPHFGGCKGVIPYLEGPGEV